jgi:hypothetical protein
LLLILAVNYTVAAFSSYTSPLSNIRCPGQRSSPLAAGVTPDSLRRLNWMLNNYYNPAVGGSPTCTIPVDLPEGWQQSSTATTAGTFTITAQDMQTAVWTLTGEQA